MARNCDVCRRPDPDFDPSDAIPDLDVRQHRLLDRAIHARCLAAWTYRKQFIAQFHEAARTAGRPELTLALDGRLHEGRAPIRLFPHFRAGLVERLRLIPFRGEGTISRLWHYERVLRLGSGLVLALILAGGGVYFSVAAWPGGLVFGGMPGLVAWVVGAYVWRWSPMILAQQRNRPSRS